MFNQQVNTNETNYGPSFICFFKKQKLKKINIETFEFNSVDIRFDVFEPSTS